MRLLLAAAFALVSLPAAAQSSVPATQIISGAIDGYIRPGFHQLAMEASALRTQLASLCATPSASALTAAQDQFRKTVLAYAHVEFITFGPLGDAGNSERLLFWPDPRGIALKQVQGVLGTKDATATNPETLKSKSIALQGLVALEFVLFGAGSEALTSAADAYRCAYGSAITVLVDGVTTELDAGWAATGPDSAAGHMLDPQPDADDYRSLNEVLGKIAGAMFDGSELIRDQRLTPVIGTVDGKPKPRSALFWRSGLSVPLIAAEFDGLKALFNAATLPKVLTQETYGWIANGTLFELDNALHAAAKVTDPIETAVTDPDQLKQLKYMSLVTSSLGTLVGDNLSGALGLTLGFSALDGD